MSREILTYPLEPEQVRAELNHVVQYLISQGFESCEVEFGFAWGNEYYTGKEWGAVALELSMLPDEVARVESLGYGCLGGLGQNDLYIAVPGLPLKFRFCNDSDIHISLDGPHYIAEALYERWRRLGYRPAEWMDSEGGPPRKRVRFE